MLANLPQLLNAAQLKVAGYEALSKAAYLRSKRAGNFLTFFEMGGKDGEEGMHAQLHSVEIPGVIRNVKQDIQEIQSSEMAPRHRDAVAYLTRFIKFLEAIPKDPPKIMQFFQDVAVPSANPHETLERFAVMLDHTIDACQKEDILHGADTDPALVKDAQGKESYSRRVMSVIEFMTADQHKFAS